MSPRLCSALLVAAGAAWAPEAEFATLHGTSHATWRGRVDAELDRSLNALPQRTTKDESVEKFRARGGASMCEVLRRGKWRGPPPPAVKVALDDSLGPRPAFAPRTGQFVVP